MKVLATGVTGYLGGRLLSRLIADGHECTAVVHSSDLTPLPDVVTRVCDPGSATELAAMLATAAPDVAIHLAAQQTLASTPADSDSLVEANIAFGARMLSAAHAVGARGLVWAHTFSAHADGTREYLPQSLYAATKQSFRDLCRYYSTSTALKCVGLELSDTYGPDDPRPKFLNSAISGEPLPATGGEQILRPIHADDVADAFIYAASRLLAEGFELDAYSVCGPSAVRLRDLVAELESATGIKTDVRWGERPYRPNEIMKPYVGEQLPGWSPRYTLREGLAAAYGTGEYRGR